VPTISRFHGIVIAMFVKDHGHPHFHAKSAGREAKIRIRPIAVIEGELGHRQLALVRIWAEQHQSELEENWRRARDHETLMPIKPLR
jgi:Domain of unknown function (DUF4160)